MDSTDAPEVSVLVVTYNHEKYVRQALDGVLMQKADFDFEVVVADDLSQDSTPEVLRRYEAESPRVRVLPTEGKLGITRNYRRGFDACRGRFVAVLEGDDFWVSPRRLEVLAAFLRRNPEYSFCFHKAIRVNEASGGAAVYPQFEGAPPHGPFTPSQLARGNFVPGLSTCVYRREVIAALDERLWSLKVREWPFNIVVAQHGPIGYVPEILSVYRAHPGGIWSLKSFAEQRAALLECIETYNEYLGFKFDAEFNSYRRALAAGAEVPAAFAEPAGDGPAPRYWRVGRRFKPFVPPVFVSLARSILRRGPHARRP